MSIQCPRIRRRRLVLLAATGMAMAPPIVLGAFNSYVGSGGNWSDPTQWTLGHQPQSGEDVDLGTAGGPINVTLDAGATSQNLNSLTINQNGGQTVTLQQASNTLSVTGTEFLGFNGALSYNQSGGSNSASMMFLGELGGPGGFYNLSGGAASAATITIGGTAFAPSGHGVFSISGTGSLVVSSKLKIWTGSTVNLSGGTLSAASIDTSGNPLGLNWTGGALVLPINDFLVDSATPASMLGSSVTISGNTQTLVLSNFEFVGQSGSGAFNQNAGTCSLGALVVASNAGSTGTYSLSAAATLSTAVLEKIGDAGNGSFNQSGGSNTTPALFVGLSAGGVGRYDQSGGSNSAPLFSVGSNPGAAGTFILSGGSANFSASFVGGNTSGAGGAGTLMVSGSGSLTVTGLIKVYSGGVFSLVGGAVKTAALDLGGNSTLLNWTGGSLTITGAAGLNVGGGSFGNALSIGSLQTLTVSNALTVGAVGSVGLSGGTITTGSLDLGGVPARLNWTAGTLNITGNTSLTIGSGGLFGNTLNLGAAQALNVSNASEFIGNGGTGSLIQTGGSHTAGALFVAANPSTTGTYNISGGSASLTSMTIGGQTSAGGVGAVTVSGANTTLSVTGVVKVFDNGSSLNLSDGTLAAQSLNLPATAFHWTSGTLHLTGSTPIGTSTSIGNTLVPAQSLIVDGNETLASAGDDTFTQSGGSSTVGGTLTIGNLGGATGTYHLSGGTLTTHITNCGADGIGVFDQTGGVNQPLALRIGDLGSDGTYSLSGSGILIATAVDIGGGGGHGTFSQNGGTFVCTTSIGVGDHSLGTYNLSGPSFLSVQYSEVVGALGPGVFNQMGGMNTVFNTLDLGYAAAGTFNLSAGTLAVSGIEIIGEQNFGTFNQTGGNNTANAVYLGQNTFFGNFAAIMNLSGGTSTFGNVSVGIQATSTLSISGTASVSVSGTTTINSGSSFTMTGGTFNGHAVSNAGTFSASSGAATLTTLSGAGSTTVGGGGAAMVSLASFAQAAITVSAGGEIAVQHAAGHLTNTATSLTITGNGMLDLNDTDLLTGTAINTIRGYLFSGYHAGAWDGVGIDSSLLAAAAMLGDHSHALGFAQTSPGVLVRYTCNGDANLDGDVNALDFNAVASNFGNVPGKTWPQGDFNYDGITNTSDFTALAANFNLSLPAPALGALLPEPALAIPLMWIISRRRRARSSLIR